MFIPIYVQTLLVRAICETFEFVLKMRAMLVFVESANFCSGKSIPGPTYMAELKQAMWQHFTYTALNARC